MGYNEQIIPKQEEEDKIIIPSGAFIDSSDPTDLEVSAWINSNVDPKEYDGSVYVYDIPGQASNGISYTYVWISVKVGSSFNLIRITDRTAGGPIGPSGKSVLTGSIIPSNANGDEGDFYLKKPEFNLYGPKVGTDWGIPTSLIGPYQDIAIGSVTNGGTAAASFTPGNPALLNLTLPNGAQGEAGSVMRSGNGVPNNALGKDGDYYMNKTNGDVYVRTSGTYGSPIANFVGPQGIQGIQGIQGLQGIPGNTGATGPAGTNGTNGADGASGLKTVNTSNTSLVWGSINVFTGSETTVTLPSPNIIDLGKEMSITNGTGGGSIAISLGTNNFIGTAHTTITIGQTVTLAKINAMNIILISKSN